MLLLLPQFYFTVKSLDSEKTCVFIHVAPIAAAMIDTGRLGGNQYIGFKSEHASYDLFSRLSQYSLAASCLQSVGRAGSIALST